ncbi:MAG: pilus assembly protein PilP [Xanthomonadales bacterium]|nr:pilus assembly protein PilP [Xanthomonadales bacterium]NIN73987.1 pilus assembly protein PilP [Xanthomonadales bacterium]NIP11114.1 pilus assembly protein PilP [Xanthomonadales bacterium]NIQ34638.1 pilus assembly protein PilP [Xanthomonadales bacterium]NIT32863.1 pilus assembly protein PilP [Xanthomonadales bacterium]
MAVLSIGLLVACGGDMSDLDSYIRDVQARPAKPIPPIPPVRTYEPYAYDGQLGRDPFRASTTEGSDSEVVGTQRSGPRPDPNRSREYLERYELDTLDMVGTFAKGDDYWGLIRDPDGVIHRVAVNNYLGKNHGRVTRIRETGVDLSELIGDGMGGWLVREATIALDES